MKKTVLVTGASRGIGAAIAKSLSTAGYNVAIGYCQNKQKAKELAYAITSEGFSAKEFFIDVSNSESVAIAIQQIIATFGNISAVVNNAGIAQQKLFCDITEDEWFDMINTNLSSVYRVCKAVLPDMIHKKNGSIINIASMWGQTGASCEVHYSAAKGGVIALTKALAKEVAPCNIRVNCVAPGAIETDMLNSFSQKDKAAIADETPLARLGTPSEIADVVEFLLSDKASFLTGQVIGVNGGLVC